MPWQEVTDPTEMAAAQAMMQGAGGRNAASAPGGVAPRIATARLARRQLDDIEAAYNKNLKGTGLLKSAMEYLPSQENAQFDALAQGLAPIAQALTRVPGSGTTSDKDADLLREAYIPSHSAFDSANEQRIKSFRRVIDSIDPPAPRPMTPAAPRPMTPKAAAPAATGWKIERVR